MSDKCKTNLINSFLIFLGIINAAYPFVGMFALRFILPKIFGVKLYVFIAAIGLVDILIFSLVGIRMHVNGCIHKYFENKKKTDQGLMKLFDRIFATDLQVYRPYEFKNHEWREPTDFVIDKSLYE
jgi:hypothetical protein